MLDIKAEDYMKSLVKLKYFPSETYIFPKKKVLREDI
jgi:hypothetical protein